MSEDFLAEPFTPIEILRASECDVIYKCEHHFMKSHAKIIREFEKLESDSKKFVIERILNPGKDCGGQIIAIMEDGKVFERANVHFGLMKGVLPINGIKIMRAKTKFTSKANFIVVSLSSVVHPKNPHVPNFHFNYRYFVVTDPSSGYSEWWFGGVTDLTPNYLIESDVKHFHNTLKATCDAHNQNFYPKFKQECDKYFYNVHRKEHRGVGGIFFDDMDEPSQEEAFKLVKSLVDSIEKSYLPLVKRNMSEDYDESHREWQLTRRGRYVEFNLVYDRGTKFGLQMPNAPVESILMSMPLVSRWNYKRLFDEKEQELQNVLKNPRDWV